MAVTNPTAVAFCNTRTRPAADKLAQAYYLAKQITDEWAAKEIGSLLVKDGGIVADGAEADGRNPITADAAVLMIGVLGDFIADLEANDNAKLHAILAIAVNVNP